LIDPIDRHLEGEFDFKMRFDIVLALIICDFGLCYGKGIKSGEDNQEEDMISNQRKDDDKVNIFHIHFFKNHENP